MGFTDKYTTSEKITAETNVIILDKDLIPVEKDKVVVSNDAFALGDVIQELINKIEHARVSLS